MTTVTEILPYLQIAVSVLLIIVIILQQRGAGLGGALGGMNEGTMYHKKRGAEKVLFYATIVLGVIFATLAIISIVIQ